MNVAVYVPSPWSVTVPPKLPPLVLPGARPKLRGSPPVVNWLPNPSRAVSVTVTGPLAPTVAGATVTVVCSKLTVPGLTVTAPEPVRLPSLATNFWPPDLEKDTPNWCVP